MADDFIRELDDNGFRVTSTRRAVVESIANNDAPFSAEDLAEELPEVGRATVYRTLRLLQDMGYLCRVLMEDGSPRYQRSHKSHHHHLICVACGDVRELDCEVSDMVAPALRRSGFEPVGHRLEVYGRCRGCQERAAAD